MRIVCNIDNAIHKEFIHFLQLTTDVFQTGLSTEDQCAPSSQWASSTACPRRWPGAIHDTPAQLRTASAHPEKTGCSPLCAPDPALDKQTQHNTRVYGYFTIMVMVHIIADTSIFLRTTNCASPRMYKIQKIATMEDTWWLQCMCTSETRLRSLSIVMGSRSKCKCALSREL